MSARLQHPSSLHGGKLAVAANGDLFEGTPWATRPLGKTIGATRLRLVNPADLDDMFSATEDLWLRIKCHPSLRIYVLKDSALDMHHVLVRPVSPLDPEARQLLRAVQDRNLYAWRPLKGDHGSDRTHAHNLVRSITRTGDTVVLALTPMHRLVRQAGFGVVGQLGGLVERLLTASSTADVPFTNDASLGTDASVPGSQPHGIDGDTMAEQWQDRMRSLKIEIDALGG
ncbi:hypothetical protein [Rhodoferax sp. GW822-FHT02A01]|uniref:hypothetical protein n=1 Tax=Rhodoferax sp. GW822-FHT02A01 TaxID=3141537 RepID=UPI00315D30F1